jgi:hypothetical protein
MRTTVEINEALSREVRALMAKRNTTLRALVEEGLRRVVEESRAREEFRMRDASAGEGGLAEGVNDASWDTLSRFLYPRAS